MVLSKPHEIVAVDSVYFPIKDPVSCMVISDSILAIKHSRQKDSVLFTIYNVRSRSRVREVLYGQKEDRFLGLLYAYSSEGLVLHDFAKERFSLIKPDKIADQGKLIFHETNIHAQCILPTKGDRLLFLNSNSFENRENRLLISDAEYHYNSKRRVHIDTYNVVDGFMLMNEEGTRTYYFDKHSGIIELYDARLSCLKRMIVQDALSPDYVIYKSGKNKLRVFKGSVPYTFKAGSANPKGVLVLYDPCYLAGKRSLIYGESQPSLMMLDWEGELKTLFLIPGGRHPVQCHVTQEGRIVLLFCEDNGIKEVIYEIAS